MREVYVYYRVTDAQADAMRREVLALQAELRAAHPGLETRLLKRPEASAGLQTWMEVYARSADASGVTAELHADIEARAKRCAAHIEGPRHIEVFVELDAA